MDFPSKILEDGTIVSPGVDYGSKQPVALHRAGDYVVFKNPGATDWSGQGETSYYKTTVGIFRFGHNHQTEKGVRQAKTIIEFEPGRKHKAVVKSLIESANSLNKAASMEGVEIH